MPQYSSPPLDSFKTPGQLIDFLLIQRDWTKRVLAIILGMDESTINKIVAAKRPVDATLALALSEVFDIPAESFLDLQKSWDLTQAKLLSMPDPKRSSRARLFGNLPIGEMIKRGWIDATDVKNVPEVEAGLAKFFGAASSEEIEILPHAAKKTHVNSEATPIQLAWLYRVKEIANEMLVSQFSQFSVENCIARLSELRASVDGIQKVPRILQEAGIRYVIVEALPGSKIDGVCFWLKDTAPVIGMALRYDRIDNFWFVLRHELEHVIQGDGKTMMMLDTELEGSKAGVGADVPEEERIANRAGAEFCVPQHQLDQFIARKSPVFADRDIIGFAKTIKIHPGLVAGQLRFRTGQYKRFTHHLVKVRALFPTSPFIDGWGQIAPVGF